MFGADGGLEVLDSGDRYVFITDGRRYSPAVKIVVRPSGVYVLDPNVAGAGKISYHSSGAFHLGQPKYDPQVLYGQLDAPDAVHGYQLISRQSLNTHSFREMFTASTSTGPSKRRPGPEIDVRDPPAETRFLEIEIGVRCLPTCHYATDCHFPSRRFYREELPIASRFLVISASWMPLF